MAVAAEEMPAVEELFPVEERVSRLEGAYGHLATRVDVSDVHTSIAESEMRTTERIAEVRGEIAASEARTAERIAAFEGGFCARREFPPKGAKPLTARPSRINL